jgi:DNA-binding Lrp family transcriptional regulator
MAISSSLSSSKLFWGDYLKGNTNKILNAILKHPRASDRYIAQLIGISQPTVSRTRAKLIDKNLLKFEAIPNLVELGYEIVALTVFSSIDDLEALVNNDKVIFISDCEQGLLVISVHEKYHDYAGFIYDTNVATRILLSTEIKSIKNFTFSDFPV